jgi:hypothetical protein
MMKQIFEKLKAARQSFTEKGFVTDTVAAMQSLFVGLGVIVLTVILVGVLGGKAYNTVQSDITGITEGNIKADVNAAIVNGFEGLNQGSTFLPLIVLAVVFGLILVIIGGGLYARRR